jgi:cation:H+ antiporter
MIYLQTLMGLVILLLGGDFLVRGAVDLAKRLGVSALVIGLTVVALGTSAPELVVSLQAALGGTADIALGNVIGSNIANILLVLGVPSLLYPTTCDAPLLRRNTTFAILIAVLFIGLSSSGVLEFWNGVVLTLILAAFVGYSSTVDRRLPAVTQEFAAEVEHHTYKGMTTAQSVLFVVGGLAGLLAGAKFLVDGAVEIARAAEISEAVIGLTLVAIGTSMPELVTALIAAARRHSDVVVGTVLGSCIFNLAGVIGITALVTDVPVGSEFLQFDLWVMIGALLLLTIFIFTRMRIGRRAGVLYLAMYGAYMWALLHGYSAVDMVMG